MEIYAFTRAANSVKSRMRVLLVGNKAYERHHGELMEATLWQRVSELIHSSYEDAVQIYMPLPNYTKCQTCVIICKKVLPSTPILPSPSLSPALRKALVSLSVSALAPAEKFCRNSLAGNKMHIHLANVRIQQHKVFFLYWNIICGMFYGNLIMSYYSYVHAFLYLLETGLC